MQYVVVDFETEAIGSRPNDYPPKPVGVAIRWENGRSEYLSWGHPTGNNSTFDDARRALWTAWQRPCVFHNAAFDLEVAHRWMGFPAPMEWHDTMLLMFLCYPHAESYALKPVATWMLSEPPTERDTLTEWIVANVPGATKKNAGAHISKAPAELVEPYAIGDVTRTHGIFAHLWPHVRATMLAPYNRERALLPWLVDASRRGVRVDRGLLQQWQVQLTGTLELADIHIRTALDAPTLNVDANDEVADAIENAGLLRPEGWLKTATGKRSTSKDALALCVTDKRVVEKLRYRNTQATLLRTFVDRWLTDSATDGRLHCSWHQTRTDEGGTRTGRVASSHPNLANVPNPQDKVVVPPGLMSIPNMREALLPEQDHLWVSADYKSQELRILAHYEDGAIMQAYNADPELDLHDFARKLIVSRTGINIDRKATKTVGFAQLYGAGVPKLAAQLGVTESAARDLRDAYFAALPGVLTVKNAASTRWARGENIVTWGGRRVPPQPGEYANGQFRTFDYKAMNMLIQGSAADQTKEALVRWFAVGPAHGGFFLSQLYDEINVSVPKDAVRDGEFILRDSMTAIPGFDVPFSVDVEVGPTWGTMQPYKEIP